LLADGDFRVQAAAIESLATIGDPAAIAPLRRMIDRELDGRLRRRGREVIRDLAEGAPLADDVRRLRDELGDLRALAGVLRDRVELLEVRLAERADKKAAKKAAKAARKAKK
jgi:aminopeptidase N